MSQMLKSSGAMAAATLTSRILGMVREVVYSWFMGVSWVAGSFQLAFTIPNLFRRLLGEGALTAAFIPIFKEKERKESEAEMWRAANAVISGLIFVATIITIVAMIAITITLAVRPHLATAGSPIFAVDDIKDLPSLVLKLQRQADPVSQYLNSQFSDAARAQLLAGSDTNIVSKMPRVDMAAELNRIIKSGPIYTPARFAGVVLSEKTKLLLARNPVSGEHLTRLNRLLVQDAYPQELEEVPKTELMLRLLRVMFPYMLLICLTAVFMGMLNARGHFFIPATGALIMNLVMIASVFLLAPHLGRTLREQIYALAFGVLVAGIAQAAFQLPTLRREGFRYYWVSPWREPTVRRVVRQMIPGTIGVAAFQLNVLMTQGIAFWVDPSIVASFQYAVRLMELPQGVFGISLATYLLPTLSGFAAEKKYDDFRSTLNQGMDTLIYLNLLASLLLFILAEPIIRLLFEHGKFTSNATQGVSFALMCLAPGLLAFSMVNILARAFYALGDTKTPMKISIVCLLINLVLALMLVQKYRQGGLGIANTVGATVNVSVLFYTLRRKLGHLQLAQIERILFHILGAAFAAGIVAWGLNRWWEHSFGHEGMTRRLVAVFLPMTAASIVYWGIALALKVPPAIEMGQLVLQRFGLNREKPDLRGN